MASPPLSTDATIKKLITENLRFIRCLILENGLIITVLFALGELGDADPEDLNVESETIEGQTLRDTFNVKDQVVPSEDNVEPQEDTVEGTRVKMTRATPQTQDDDDDVAIETEGDDDDIIEEFDKGLL